MIFSKVFTALSIFLLYINISNVLNCRCPSYLQQTNVEVSGDTSTAEIKNEIIENVDYGKPVVIENMLFLSTTFDFLGAVDKLYDPCPVGSNLPYEHEIKILADSKNQKDVVEKLKKIGLTTNNTFFSSKKSNSLYDVEDKDAWNFKGIKFSEDGNSVVMGDYPTYLNQQSSRVVCSINSSKAEFTYNGYDYIVGETYESKVLGSNIIGADWEIDGKKVSGLSASISFKDAGCKLIRLWTKNVIGEVGYSCKEVYSVDNFGSDGKDESLSEKNIMISDLYDEIKKIDHIFFNRPNAAMASAINGDYYVLYADIKKKLKVAVLNNYFKVDKIHEIDSDKSPMDIASTEDGFIVYAKNYDDNSFSYLRGYTINYNTINLKFENVLINNGELPEKAIDQISFKTSFVGKPLGGTEVMFSNGNGKISYGQGRFSVIFAHYNHFGFYKNGERNDHTGDTFYTFDKNGKSPSYAWGWKTSHSLYQLNFYDGRYFITASLGDMYPKQIQVCFVLPKSNFYSIDISDKIASFCSSDLIDGIIEGDGAGVSYGRLGGMFKIKEYYYLVYSRKSSGEKLENGLGDEIGILKFKFNEFNEKGKQFYDKKIFRIGSANDVANIRAGRLGSRIVILLSIDANPKPKNQPNDAIDNPNNQMIVYLLDSDNCTVISNFVSKKYSVPVTSDLIYTKYGGIAWPFVDKTDGNKLKVARIDNLAYEKPYVNRITVKTYYKFDDESNKLQIVNNSFYTKANLFVAFCLILAVMI